MNKATLINQEENMGPYKIIYADPPWSYKDKANAGKRGSGHKYDIMTVEEIRSLPVNDIAADDCLLAMWWVAPMPFEALSIVEAWGFKLKTMKGFTWHKETKFGKSHFGMGNWTRANTEDCLFAVKGNPRRINAGVRQYVSSLRREHSRKPEEVRISLVTLMGDLPRVELFARQKTEGWDVFGNEVEESIEL